MALLELATNDQIAMKCAVFGRAGAGKTLTSTLIAIGLAKEKHPGHSIAMLDTESGSDFVAHLCQVEGVPLVRIKSRSFLDMKEALTEAEQSNCCAYLVDSYSQVWNELNEAFRRKMNLVGKPLSFQHRDNLEAEWQVWIDAMLASALHVFLIGRLGHEWSDVETDEGDIEHVRLGTKLRGKPDAGHEPHLLLEMEAVQGQTVRVKNWKKNGEMPHRRGGMVHTCRVVKDRWRALNGVTFQWPDLNDYRLGDFREVYAKFQPHVARLSTAPRSASHARTSDSLFSPRGDSWILEDRRRVVVAVEEFQATINLLWPGTSADAVKLRNLITATVFHSLSWTKIGSLTPEEVEQGWRILSHFKDAAVDINIRDEAQVIACITDCQRLERDAAAAMVT